MPRRKSTLRMGYAAGVGSKPGGRKLASSSGIEWQKQQQERLKREEEEWNNAKKQWKNRRRRGYV